MKKKLIAFAIVLTTQIFSQATVTTGHGRASDKAIMTGRSELKKQSCCETARYNAYKKVGHFQSSIVITGNSKKPYISLKYGNAQKRTGNNKCTSLHNQYEECKVQIQDNTPFAFRSKSRSGWIDENTYVVISEGKASFRAITKNSYAMKETTCIEATKLNAIYTMVQNVAQSIYGNDEKVDFKIKSPKIWVKSCRSEKNEYEQCKCKIVLHDKGLKQKVIDRL
ncbi:MAG: hypothetical protein AAF518_00840 [Spirochaetota bacterium]